MHATFTTDLGTTLILNTQAAVTLQLKRENNARKIAGLPPVKTYSVTFDIAD